MRTPSKNKKINHVYLLFNIVLGGPDGEEGEERKEREKEREGRERGRRIEERGRRGGEGRRDDQGQGGDRRERIIHLICKEENKTFYLHVK